MKYYILKTTTEAKNTAIIESYEPNYDRDSPFSQCNMKVWEFTDFDPVFSKLVFKRGFRMVDFISPDTIECSGFIISERIKSIVNNFDLIPNKLFNLPSYEYKGIIYNYSLLQLIRSKFDYTIIDFDKSIFYKEERISLKWGNNIETLTIKNAKEYGEIVENIKDPFIRVSDSRLVLHKKPKDLFAIHNVHRSNYIISERLKLVLEEMKTTGLEDFVEIEIEYNEE